MNISKKREYGTVSNPTIAVRIYATDGGGSYPIHGARYCPNRGRWFLECWSSHGESDWESQDNLVQLEGKEGSNLGLVRTLAISLDNNLYSMSRLKDEEHYNNLGRPEQRTVKRDRYLIALKAVNEAFELLRMENMR